MDSDYQQVNTNSDPELTHLSNQRFARISKPPNGALRPQQQQHQLPAQTDLPNEDPSPGMSTRTPHSTPWRKNEWISSLAISKRNPSRVRNSNSSPRSGRDVSHLASYNDSQNSLLSNFDAVINSFADRQLRTNSQVHKDSKSILSTLSNLTSAIDTLTGTFSSFLNSLPSNCQDA